MTLFRRFLSVKHNKFRLDYPMTYVGIPFRMIRIRSSKKRNSSNVPLKNNQQHTDCEKCSKQIKQKHISRRLILIYELIMGKPINKYYASDFHANFRMNEWLLIVAPVRTCIFSMWLEYCFGYMLCLRANQHRCEHHFHMSIRTVSAFSKCKSAQIEID